MSKSFRTLVASAFASAVLATPNAAEAILAPPPALCSIAKAKASAVAFRCHLKQQSRIALGSSGNPASCDERLAKRFASAESRGECVTSGDAALASSRASSSASDVLEALQVELIANDDQKSCFEKKGKLAGRYATCVSAALLNRLKKNYDPPNSDFYNCRMAHIEGSEALDASTDCASTLESELVRELSGRGYGFFPGTVWTTSEDQYNELELAGAPLAHAYLAGATFNHVSIAEADFRGADFSGATLEDVELQVGSDYVTDFRDAVFDGATVTAVRFSADLLEGAEFANATFTRIWSGGLLTCPASLPVGWICAGGFLLGPTVYMNGGDLGGLDLSGLDLSGSYMQYVHLEDAILEGVDLSDSFLQYVSLKGADLGGADLSGSTMNWLGGASLIECPAVMPSGWSCVNNNLLGSYAVLDGCSLAGADLAGVNMYEMDFFDCDLSGANLAGANLGWAGFSNTICPDLTLSTTNGYTCCGHHVGSPPLYCGD